MPIRVTLDRVLLERRMSLTELCEKVGITLANLSILKTGKARAVRFTTLDALCRVLECQPGDILTWEPGGSADDEAGDEPGADSDDHDEGETTPSLSRTGVSTPRPHSRPPA
jgi:putative transcriptional regulator